MQLELDGEYLIDSIKMSYTSISYGLQSVKVLRETGLAYQIELENGEKIWSLKSWRDPISIIEKI